MTAVEPKRFLCDAVFVLSSPAFDFTSPAVPGHVRYAGPQLDEPAWAAPWQSPWADEDERPLVLVGLGSTFQNQGPVLRRVIEALAALPVHGLVTLGEVLDPAEFPATDNVRVVRSASHAAVLPQASLLVTHGGHGTTIKGLAAGVPLVCLPLGRDQKDTAARVVARGAGVRLKPTAPAAKIRQAVERVLAEPSYRAAAGRLARAIAAGDGTVDVVAELERLAGARTAAPAGTGSGLPGP